MNRPLQPVGSRLLTTSSYSHDLPQAVYHLPAYDIIFPTTTKRGRGHSDMFTLNDILQGNEDTIRLQGASSADIEQVFPAAQHDSRQVGQGDLFIAIKGEHVDGHSFIPAAAQAGAGAVLCTEPSTKAPPELL